MNGQCVIVGQAVVTNAVPSSLDANGDQQKFLRGYNTFHKDGDATVIASAINGVVEVTDCVISVRGMSPRYVAEIGDVVVGRIVDVAGNKWRVDVGGVQHAVLLLANVTEPGGMLRRRGRADELTMQQLFKEDDVVVAEVQRVSPDGVISLHTRTADKYGKMSNLGRLVHVKPSLIRRTKRQFHTFLTLGVTVVIGMNGTVWASVASDTNVEEALRHAEKLAQDSEELDDDDVSAEEARMVHSAGASELDATALADRNDPVEMMQSVALVANVVERLGLFHVLLFPGSIYSGVQFCRSRCWRAYDLLDREKCSAMVLAVRTMVTAGKHSGGPKRPRE